MPIAITEWIFWSTTEHHEQWGIQVVWETGLGTQTLASKKHSFFGSISTKVYVEVGISDFTTYLIMTNILTEEENNETKNFEAKEETLYESVFIYLNT